jgi:uncharacterized membrane protein
MPHQHAAFEELQMEEVPTGDKAVYRILEIFALAFVFAGVDAYSKGKPFLQAVLPCLPWWVASVLLFVVGVKWPAIRSKAIKYLLWLITAIGAIGFAYFEFRYLQLPTTFYSWVALVLILAVMVVIGYPLTLRRPRAHIGILYRIEFDYLPISPLERGWKQAYKPDATATFIADPEIRGGLRMEVTNSIFAMDHRIPKYAAHSDALMFTAIYSAEKAKETLIFAGIDVTTKDGAECKKCWFKFYHDRTLKASKTSGDIYYNPAIELPEQTIWLPALQRDRMVFNINLPEVVNLAFGDQGWMYKSIWAVRIRGNLAVSPFAFGHREMKRQCPNNATP